jgi:hypothetical protein
MSKAAIATKRCVLCRRIAVRTESFIFTTEAHPHIELVVDNKCLAQYIAIQTAVVEPVNNRSSSTKTGHPICIGLSASDPVFWHITPIPNSPPTYTSATLNNDNQSTQIRK